MHPVVVLLRYIPYNLILSKIIMGRWGPAVSTLLLPPPNSFSSYHHVATKFPDLPANISHNTQGALDELSLDVSNDMNQSDGNVKQQALSPN
ncbi:hypothetical protein DSO57_1013819 [Entomophthora muscae]|uniref:Uncharacterized protein n=1 Tax=Entomophthora muscae TaxID=34485 RepID=A0ACC2TU67_9FUNG|nr:hypothetical protein DSO57_1013819 [Entomophthora muscae]